MHSLEPITRPQEITQEQVVYDTLLSWYQRKATDGSYANKRKRVTLEDVADLNPEACKEEFGTNKKADRNHAAVCITSAMTEEQDIQPSLHELLSEWPRFTLFMQHVLSYADLPVLDRVPCYGPYQSLNATQEVDVQMVVPLTRIKYSLLPSERIQVLAQDKTDLRHFVVGGSKTSIPALQSSLQVAPLAPLSPQSSGKVMFVLIPHTSAPDTYRVIRISQVHSMGQQVPRVLIPTLRSHAAVQPYVLLLGILSQRVAKEGREAKGDIFRWIEKLKPTWKKNVKQLERIDARRFTIAHLSFIHTVNRAQAFGEDTYHMSTFFAWLKFMLNKYDTLRTPQLDHFQRTYNMDRFVAHDNGVSPYMLGFTQEGKYEDAYWNVASVDPSVAILGGISKPRGKTRRVSAVKEDTVQTPQAIPKQWQIVRAVNQQFLFQRSLK